MPTISEVYWISRIQKEADKLYDLSFKQYRKELKKAYKYCMAECEKEMVGLYVDISQDKASLNDLYRYGRYDKLYKQLGSYLIDNGKQEYKLLDSTLETMYDDVQHMIKDLSPFDVPMANKQQIAEVVKAVWCQDGKSFSDRIWLDKADMQQRLSKGLVNCVSTGASKDKLVKDIAANMDVAFNQSDCLVRTELSRVQNQSAANSYIAAGITEYEFVDTEDERTCDICSLKDGKKYKYSNIVIGKNFPPLHPNCRCCVVPVIK